MFRRSTLPLLIILALSACSRQGGLWDDSQRQQMWDARQQVVGELLEWNLYARGALRLKGEAYNVGIRWQRVDNDRFTMFLEAPFGQGVLRIDGLGPERFQLRLPNGSRFENSSAEALLDEAVGWSLPIRGLDYWIRGLPDPRSASRHRLDAAGRAESIEQDGWDISYQGYFDDERPALPRRLSLANDKLTLKLVIERWQQAPTDSSDADLFPSFD